jgi:hypothetical protein
MACNTSLIAITKGCDNNAGGLTKFYVIPAEEVNQNGFTFGTGTTEVITGITMTASGNTWTEFEFNKNVANYEEVGTISLENGSTYFAQTVNLTIPRREAAKRAAIQLIASGQRDLQIIVKDGNGLYWFIGYENFANLTATGGGSGTVKGDGSQYTLTFLAEEPVQAFEVLASAIAL